MLQQLLSALQEPLELLPVGNLALDVYVVKRTATPARMLTRGKPATLGSTTCDICRSQKSHIWGVLAASSWSRLSGGSERSVNT